MASLSPEKFEEQVALALIAALPRPNSGRLCIAFSGGLDSTVLLTAVAKLRARHEWQVRAIHIDHQLHPDSGKWAEHCRSVAQSLGIELTAQRVVVARDHPQGLESGARAARYDAFNRELQHGEALLTAHHADDQAETVLLALLRGSGVRGLAAMPAAKVFGRGWHVRPLLEFTRATLSSWAAEQGIQAIDDPSNAHLRHDRNFLRHEVLPRLRERWPATSDSIGRSARHLGDALGLLDAMAASDLTDCGLERCLQVDRLRALPSDRQRNVLRYWLRLRGVPLPSTRKTAGLLQDLFNMSLDRIPCVTWQGAELHVHRGRVYADPPRPALTDTHLYMCDWPWQAPLELPGGLGSLSLRSTKGPGFSAAKLPDRLTVRFRRGGEKIQLSGRRHRSALRNLLQDHDVLPWWRDRLPLIVAEKKLLAVGDLFVSSEFAAQPGEAALVPVWEGAPEWKAVCNGDE